MEAVLYFQLCIPLEPASIMSDDWDDGPSESTGGGVSPRVGCTLTTPS